MGAVNHRPQGEQLVSEDYSVVMSLLKYILLVVMLALVPSTQPQFNFATLGAAKDSAIASLAQTKANLLRPVLSLKQGLLGAKSSILRPLFRIKDRLASAKFGLARGVFGAKLGLKSTILRPFFGAKSRFLVAKQKLLDSKIRFLDSLGRK